MDGLTDSNDNKRGGAYVPWLIILVLCALIFFVAAQCYASFTEGAGRTGIGQNE